MVPSTSGRVFLFFVFVVSSVVRRRRCSDTSSFAWKCVCVCVCTTRDDHDDHSTSCAGTRVDTSRANSRRAYSSIARGVCRLQRRLALDASPVKWPTRRISDRDRLLIRRTRHYTPLPPAKARRPDVFAFSRRQRAERI